MTSSKVSKLHKNHHFLVYKNILIIIFSLQLQHLKKIYLNLSSLKRLLMYPSICSSYYMQIM